MMRLPVPPPVAKDEHDRIRTTGVDAPVH